MAKQQNKDTDTQTAGGLSGAEAVRELQEQLAGMKIPQEMKDKLLNTMRDTHSAGAVESLVADLNKVVNHDKHADAATLLAGKKISFGITFPAEAGEGEDEDAARTSVRVLTVKAKKEGAGGAGRSSRKVIVNGEEYPTAAAACEANGLDHKGTSAVRVLKSALASEQIESLSFPSDDAEDEQLDGVSADEADDAPDATDEA